MRTLTAVLLLTGASANAQINGALDAPTRDTLVLAKQFYFQNDMAQALPLFRVAARRSSTSAELHVWIAEAARRSGSLDEARREARAALALQSCNALAHLVLANSLNPQFATDDAANSDSAWFHLRSAIQCDSTDGNAWLSLVFEAARKGDSLLERHALRSLVSTGFLTSVQLTNARWILSLLPPRAVLLTAGDMDTYPILAAQEALGLRRDVAVVNASMLDLDWYGPYVFHRNGITFTNGPPSIKVDTTKSLSENAVLMLRAAAAQGHLGRPLVMSNTFGTDYPRAGPGFATLKGPYWLISADSSMAVDTTSIRHAIETTEGLDWTGEAISRQDLSPIRRTTMHPVAGIAYYVIEAGEMMRAANAGYAEQQIAWANAFLARAGFDAATRDQWIAYFRSEVRK